MHSKQPSNPSASGPPDGAPEDDLWSKWLLEGRFGSDDTLRQDMQSELRELADQVLDRAAIVRGDSPVILDVGAGDGLVSLRAIERYGRGLQLWLTDLSPAALAQAQRHAQARGLQNQCRFLHGSAEFLEGVPDGSVDVVITRAVLAYVSEKHRALKEFHRVLKPGGRISLVEPLMREEALGAMALKQYVQNLPAGEDGAESQLLRCISLWKSAQYPDEPQAIQAHPMTAFSARDHFDAVQGAGFTDVLIEHQMRSVANRRMAWDTFCARVPHPWAPSLAQLFRTTFSEVDRVRLETHLRPQVEGGQGTSVNHLVFVSGRK